MKKLLMGSSMVLAMFIFFSISVSAEENKDEPKINEIMASGNVLVEEEPSISKKKEQEVIEDMKKYPERVQFATPIDQSNFETQATLPFNFSYNFKYQITTENFSNFTYPRQTVTLNVNKSSASYVYASLYRLSDNYFFGTRIYPTGQASSASFTNAGLGTFYVRLTNSSPSGSKVTTSGTGGVTGGY